MEQASIDLQTRMTYALCIRISRYRAPTLDIGVIQLRRVQVRDPERGQILTSSNVTIVTRRFEETLSVGHPDLEPRAPRADASKITRFSRYV